MAEKRLSASKRNDELQHELDVIKRVLRMTQKNLREADRQLEKSEAQNYCKICGNNLDGYKTRKETNMD